MPFQKVLSKKFGFERIRIYGQIKNAYTFTDYSGFDPEISSGVLRQWSR